MTIEKTIDTKGLNCPIPVLRTKKALAEIDKGAMLEVLATDPGSVADIAALCRAIGSTLIEQTEAAGVYRFVIRS